MKKVNKLAAVAIVISQLIFIDEVAASPNMVPGLWEITYATKNPYLPTAQENRIRQCIKPSDIKDGMPLTPEDASNKCQMVDYKVNGNTATWSLSCNGPTKVTGTGSATFAGESYSGNTDMSVHVGGQTMKVGVNFSAKRVGNCGE